MLLHLKVWMYFCVGGLWVQKNCRFMQDCSHLWDIFCPTMELMHKTINLPCRSTWRERLVCSIFIYFLPCNINKICNEKELEFPADKSLQYQTACFLVNSLNIFFALLLAAHHLLVLVWKDTSLALVHGFSFEQISD